MSVGARARQVAPRDALGRVLEREHRAGDRSCEEEADRGDRTEHDDGEPDEREPIAPHPPVDGRRRVGDAHGSEQLAGRRCDRYRDVEQVLVERVRVTGAGRDIAVGEHLRDLGACRKVATRSRVGIADARSCSIHHHDAAADLGAVLVGHLLRGLGRRRPRRVP